MAAARERRVAEFSSAPEQFVDIYSWMELLGRFSISEPSPRLVGHAQLMALALFVGVLTALRPGRQGWVD